MSRKVTDAVINTSFKLQCQFIKITRAPHADANTRLELHLVNAKSKKGA